MLIALKHSTTLAVITTLEYIRENEKKANIAAEAKGLLKNVKEFEFILALEVLEKVVHLSKGVSDKLTDLLAAIKVLRCEAKFESFWKSTLERCCELGIAEPKEDCPHKLPRLIDDNPQTAVYMSAKDKLRVSFYYNVLDLMTASIESRFDANNAQVLQGLGFLHPCRLEDPGAWRKISVAVKWFQKDLDIDALQTEIFSLQVSSLLTGVLKKAESEKRRATFVDLFTVLNEEPECYGTTIKLMEIALTLPLTSCSAERAFSKLKLIKSRLRSTMNQERLQSLMLMSVESDIMEELDVEKLVQDFVDISQRRMNLV
ncbi:zinc finger MYM-type 1-like [Paramuricea clavata]|uniref:Zinc finger MYM-type 1-like n=1 Tax=Paramuricea clavata TaxID=317549 RepID=A0A6S7JW92_PARCT|nr:zinc finger MYM-type 1-like [Paramuricea clavata]